MHPVKTKINKKYEMLLPRYRAQWYRDNLWEEIRTDSILNTLKADDVVYYVGAEVGDLPALIKLHTGCKMAMFEPNLMVWPTIKLIWEMNNLTPEYTFAGFASNKTKDPIEPDEVLKGHYKNVDGWPKYSTRKVKKEHGFSELYLEANGIPQIKLDDVGFLPPTAIVMDVEGSELEVLKGAEQLIDKYKPKIWISIHPEFLALHWNIYARDVRNWIIGKGYTEVLQDYHHECHFYYEV